MAAAILEPRTIDEAASLLRAAHDDARALAFVGGGTETELGNAPTRVDATLDTRALSRVIEYAPEDLVISVESGVTLAALQATVGAHRQRLAIDPPLADRATIGGLLATNGFGPRRTRFGSLRDQIIGISLVRADGTLVRGGGKVVKNVAGFDLPKLAVGSLGTLGMIASATFRLHPVPELERWIRVPECRPEIVRALCVAIAAAQLEPAAVVGLRNGDTIALHVLFEGFASGCDDQCARFVDIARELGSASEVLGAADATIFTRVHEAHRTSGDVRLKLAVLPTDLTVLDATVVVPSLATLTRATSVSYPLLGIAFVCGDSADDAATVAAIANARALAERAGGSLVVHAAPAGVRGAIDAWGTPPPSIELMRRLKARFDPLGQLSPGRFVGGL